MGSCHSYHRKAEYSYSRQYRGNAASPAAHAAKAFKSAYRVVSRRQSPKDFPVEQPDLINAHTPVPYLADIARRECGSIPFVLTYHNDLAKDFLLTSIVVRLAHLTLIRRTLNRSTRIIATSAFYVRDSPYLKSHQAKIRLVSPGVDVSRFNPRVDVDAEILKRFDGQRVILLVGSVSKSHQHKGLDVLIGAFSKVNAAHPELRLVIVGNGNGLPMYRSLAADAGVADKVEFTGYVGDDQLAVGSAGDGICHAFYESQRRFRHDVCRGRSATGTPVVGCSVGGVPYAIKHGETGLLAEPNSVDSLYSALLRILEDDELARRLGEAGSERAAREFAWPLIGQSTSEIFCEASS